MAISHLAPVDADLVTLDEGVELLRDTGHPVAKSTLKRWLDRHSVTVVKGSGRRDHVSFTDVLEVHRIEVARRLGDLN